MLNEQAIPNWEKLSELNPVTYRLFASERWQQLVQTMYNEVIMDPKANNNDIVSRFKQTMEYNTMMKMMFTTWAEGFQERTDGPITYKEVLQFINYLGMAEERHAMRLLKADV